MGNEGEKGSKKKGDWEKGREKLREGRETKTFCVEREMIRGKVGRRGKERRERER